MLLPCHAMPKMLLLPFFMPKCFLLPLPCYFSLLSSMPSAIKTMFMLPSSACLFFSSVLSQGSACKTFPAQKEKCTKVLCKKEGPTPPLSLGKEKEGCRLPGHLVTGRHRNSPETVRVSSEAGVHMHKGHKAGSEAQREMVLLLQTRG